MLLQSLMPFVADFVEMGQESSFYFAIAPFIEGADGTSAARLREVQLQNKPNSGMVTTMDVGQSIL